MATTAQAPIADLSEIQTRQTRAGWELLCPVCRTWVKALLTTEGGRQMCADCWRRQGDFLHNLTGGR